MIEREAAIGQHDELLVEAYNRTEAISRSGGPHDELLWLALASLIRQYMRRLQESDRERMTPQPSHDHGHIHV